ncbi:MAG TPA: hypothetical protein VGO56_22195 [Pyrinomonadaceae bacterium]|nr:hypothetical protein [Pyrinomonadaceae bacterium]
MINEFARRRLAQILGAAPPREFEPKRDPEVAPLATFAARLPTRIERMIVMKLAEALVFTELVAGVGT